MADIPQYIEGENGKQLNPEWIAQQKAAVPIPPKPSTAAPTDALYKNDLQALRQEVSQLRGLVEVLVGRASRRSSVELLSAKVTALNTDKTRAAWIEQYVTSAGINDKGSARVIPSAASPQALWIPSNLKVAVNDIVGVVGYPGPVSGRQYMVIGGGGGTSTTIVARVQSSVQISTLPKWEYTLTDEDSNTYAAWNLVETDATETPTYIMGSPGALGTNVDAGGSVNGTNCQIQPAGPNCAVVLFHLPSDDTTWYFIYYNSAD